MSELNGAIFSSDGKHRFSLWRTLDDCGGPSILLIGLNPSTANKDRNDPTITREMGFARSMGFSKLYKGNLYSYVTAYPKELTIENCAKWDEENKISLSAMARASLTVVLCCGNNGILNNKCREIAEFIKPFNPNPLMCFGINKNGQPKHPLYLSKNTKLMKYE